MQEARVKAQMYMPGIHPKFCMIGCDMYKPYLQRRFDAQVQLAGTAAHDVLSGQMASM